MLQDNGLRNPSSMKMPTSLSLSFLPVCVCECVFARFFPVEWIWVLAIWCVCLFFRLVFYFMFLLLYFRSVFFARWLLVIVRFFLSLFLCCAIQTYLKVLKSWMKKMFMLRWCRSGDGELVKTYSLPFFKVNWREVFYSCYHYTVFSLCVFLLRIWVYAWGLFLSVIYTLVSFFNFFFCCLLASSYY